jgi:hypothetical protein
VLPQRRSRARLRYCSDQGLACQGRAHGFRALCRPRTP